MNYFSQFLSALLKSFEAHKVRKTSVWLAVTSHPLTPEALEQSMSDWAAKISPVLNCMSEYSSLGSALRLHAEPGHGVAGLCAIRLKIQCSSIVPEVELEQILADRLDALQATGAWTNMYSTAINTIELDIEFGIKASLPDSVSAFPSWLFGRQVLLVGQPESELNRHVAAPLMQTGGQVSQVTWKGAQTVDYLTRAHETEGRTVFTVINLPAVTSDIAETERILRLLVSAGLVVNTFDLVCLVSPLVWEGLSDLVKIQMGHRLIQAPLTAHLLRSPKSTLYQAGNEYLTQLVFGSMSNLGELRILLVEDCSMTSSLISNYLSARGCRVFGVGSAEEAIAHSARHEYDLCLIDIGLPGKPGYSLVEQLREDQAKGAKMPIVGITASRRVADYRNCFDHGMNDCLTKPLNFRELMSKILCWVHLDAIGSAGVVSLKTS